MDGNGENRTGAKGMNTIGWIGIGLILDFSCRRMFGCIMVRL